MAKRSSPRNTWYPMSHRPMKTHFWKPACVATCENQSVWHMFETSLCGHLWKPIRVTHLWKPICLIHLWKPVCLIHMGNKSMWPPVKTKTVWHISLNDPPTKNCLTHPDFFAVRPVEKEDWFLYQPAYEQHSN